MIVNVRAPGCYLALMDARSSAFNRACSEEAERLLESYPDHLRISKLNGYWSELQRKGDLCVWMLYVGGDYTIEVKVIRHPEDSAALAFATDTFVGALPESSLRVHSGDLVVSDVFELGTRDKSELRVPPGDYRVRIQYVSGKARLSGELNLPNSPDFRVFLIASAAS